MLPSQSYVLGDSDGELRRLLDQSRFIGDLTEQVLRRAGIEPGMNVLDCGCGVGDVSFLVASLVGPTGRILGIDRSIAGVDLARRRAAEAGLANVTFEVADLADFRPSKPLDVLVGRLILMYLPEPATILSHLARHVRPGGLSYFRKS
jgi:ubiquinone/menaquinone biosynthesis C-methylase UbiE